MFTETVWAVKTSNTRFFAAAMDPSDTPDRRTPPAAPLHGLRPTTRPRGSPRRSGPAEVETFQIARWLTGVYTESQHVPELVAGTEKPFRPALRLPIPVITVLDDGSLE